MLIYITNETLNYTPQIKENGQMDKESYSISGGGVSG